MTSSTPVEVVREPVVVKPDHRVKRTEEKKVFSDVILIGDYYTLVVGMVWCTIVLFFLLFNGRKFVRRCLRWFCNC